MKHTLNFKVPKYFLRALLVLLAIVFVIFQLTYDWHIHQVEASSDITGQPIITSLLDTAVNGLTTPAPVDAQTGQIYFPDVRLMLPQPNVNLGLRELDYSNVGNGSSLDLQVTTKDILSQSESKLLTAQADAQSESRDANAQLLAIFSEVPNLQACARGAQLFYQPQNDHDSTFKLRFTKKLANGKTIYAYSETTCQSVLLPVLLNYLKQIQSY